MPCVNEEASKRGEELMEINVADASKGCVTQINENGLLLWPVSPQVGGEGLPYAPVDWPSPGDVWEWRVGKRVAISGYYLDRYLYLPIRFQKSRRKRDGFASKLAVENYIRAKFPGTNIDAFFSSFSWKIPSKQAYLLKDKHDALRISFEDVIEKSSPNSMSGVAVCKAGNRYCSSVVKEEASPFSATQSCDVCCSEPGFCRECCCILCCKSLDFAFGGYSYIRCGATASDGSICGHAAHVNCALRAYMAGTVGGSVGLDTEYYCRRCDTKMDLTEHVTSLLKTCESIGSPDYIEKILSVGTSILRGSKRKGSQKLSNHIETILHKQLNTEGDLQDVCMAEVDVEAVPVTSGNEGNMNSKLVNMDESSYEQENRYLKLDREVDHVLEELRKSQEQEFKIAQERLYAQKECLLGLYENILKEKSELAQRTPLVREDHLKRELIKLEEMEKISNGFGRTPKTILKQHFNVDIDD